jgi:hypothetical protein
MCLKDLADQVTTQSKKTGLAVHRREKVKYSVIFGVVEVKSPYLWQKQEGWGIRPVVEKLGIKPGGPASPVLPHRSIAVKRAKFGFWGRRILWASSQTV